MYAAAAETGDLASRIKPTDGLSVEARLHRQGAR